MVKLVALFFENLFAVYSSQTPFFFLECLSFSASYNTFPLSPGLARLEVSNMPASHHYAALRKADINCLHLAIAQSPTNTNSTNSTSSFPFLGVTGTILASLHFTKLFVLKSDKLNICIAKFVAHYSRCRSTKSETWKNLVTIQVIFGK